MTAQKPFLSDRGLAALEYAERGWHVFPAKLTEKSSHKSAEFSGGRAWGATTDRAEIIRDFGRWQRANVGIVTGPKSGFFVVECDTPKGHSHDGIAEMAALIAEHGTWDDTIEALSPSGSWHIYFRWPEGETIVNSQGQVALGIDVRGDGGMVIGVPSIKEGENLPYRWKNPPGEFELAECPAWLLDRVRSAGRTKSSEFKSDTGFTDKGKKFAEAWAKSSIDTKKHEGVLTLTSMLAQRGVEREITTFLAERACPARDANFYNLINSAYKFAPQSPDAAERASTFFSASDLKGKPVPSREWLVNGLVPMSTVTLLGGDGGTGKSLLALQLAAAIAAGRLWLGRQPRAGAAIYLSAEDDADELHRRTDEIARALGVAYDDLTLLTLRSLAGEDAQLAVETTVGLMQTALMDELDKRADADRPVVIFLDTSADLFGGNENDRPMVRRFIGFLRGLALRHGCAVILLSHPSLTGISSGTGLSGSTAWNNSVRSRLYLQRVVQDGYEADPDRRVLTTMKSNYGRVGGEIAMTWRDGVFVADEAPTGLDAMAALAKGERVFLKLLDDFTAQARRVNASSGPGYAPKVFSGHPKAEGMTKRALASAMEALLHRSAIEVAHEGPPSRRVSYLRRKGAE